MSMQRMSTVAPTERRNDLHLTSSGVGLAVRKIADFPPKDFVQSRCNPLPSSLSTPSSAPTIEDCYETTTAVAHGYQPHDTVLTQTTIKKAPGNWKVNYTLDTMRKLNVKPCRRPLTMGTQCSEMKAAFRAEPEAISRVISHSGNPQPPILADHFEEGPTKGLVPTSENRVTKGRQFVPQNQAVLDRLEPYMTTNKWHHRAFTRQELGHYPKKDVATYWQCEDYPKAWGHGVRENPLPKRLSRTDPGPMRDRTVFKTATAIRRLPQSLQPVASGTRSVYCDSYTAPPEEKRRELFHCPVSSTVKLEAPRSTLSQSFPHMYETVNTTYGKKPTTVS